MIKRKRSDDEDQAHPASRFYSSDSSPKPPKVSKLEHISDITPGKPLHTNNQGISAMNPSGQPVQPGAGPSQGSANSMEETRQKYIQIQQSLKNEIQQFGQNHPRGIAAMKKLEQFNQHMAHLRSQQQSQRQAAANAAAAATQQNQMQMQAAAQARPVVSTVATNPPSRPAVTTVPASQPVTANAPVGAGGSSQPMKLLVPGHIDANNADNWRREAESRLRTAYASMVQFRNQMQAIQGAISNTEKPLSPEEAAEKRAQLETIQKQNKKCEDFINAFRLQQTTLAANIRNATSDSATAGDQTGANSASAENAIDQIASAANLNPTGSGAPNISKPPALKPQPMQRTQSNFSSVGNAIAAASTQNSGNVTVAQANSQKSPTSANPLRNQANPATFTSPAPNTSQQSPTQGPTRVASVSAVTVAHPSGVPQTPQQQSIPESPAKVTGAPPTVPGQREGASSHRLPIPKTLSMPAPTAVPVPPARPTLPGGTHVPSGSQVVGGPAIAKAPQFELDEASGGLLSKRKLQELVRQIDPEESLDPEVEESILELTDDFVDTLLTYACRMAKHRGSDTLDIRDVQMILERNWNIRIPGYSMDDIRTVRKFNPTASYHQKLQALQAGKALNQSEMSSKDS